MLLDREKFKEALAKTGMTETELANEIGRGVREFSRGWLVNISFQSAYLIAEALNCSVDDIVIYGKGKETKYPEHDYDGRTKEGKQRLIEDFGEDYMKEKREE